MELSEETEEVAGFYARMIEHEYTTKKVFNSNFLKDWRRVSCCFHVWLIFTIYTFYGCLLEVKKIG